MIRIPTHRAPTHPGEMLSEDTVAVGKGEIERI